jgi:hypothetical protein
VTKELTAILRWMEPGGALIDLQTLTKLLSELEKETFTSTAVLNALREWGFGVTSRKGHPGKTVRATFSQQPKPLPASKADYWREMRFGFGKHAEQKLSDIQNIGFLQWYQAKVRVATVKEAIRARIEELHVARRALKTTKERLYSLTESDLARKKELRIARLTARKERRLLKRKEKQQNRYIVTLPADVDERGLF